MWHMTCDMWHVTCDMWHVTCDTWHVTRDTWHVTSDMWQVTCDTWHVWGGWTFSQNFSSLALTVCDLWYYEDLWRTKICVKHLIAAWLGPTLSLSETLPQVPWKDICLKGNGGFSCLPCIAWQGTTFLSDNYFILMTAQTRNQSGPRPCAARYCLGGWTHLQAGCDYRSNQIQQSFVQFRY